MTPSCKDCVKYKKKERKCPIKPGAIQPWNLCDDHQEKK